MENFSFSFYHGFKSNGKEEILKEDDLIKNRISVLRWQKEHPDKHNAKTRRYRRNHIQEEKEREREKSRKFRQENLELCRKYERIRDYCRYRNLPAPHLRNEEWNSNKVLVSRKNNGQFITWKEIA